MLMECVFKSVFRASRGYGSGEWEGRPPLGTAPALPRRPTPPPPSTTTLVTSSLVQLCNMRMFALSPSAYILFVSCDAFSHPARS